MQILRSESRQKVNISTLNTNDNIFKEFAGQNRTNLNAVNEKIISELNTTLSTCSLTAQKQMFQNPLLPNLAPQRFCLLVFQMLIESY